jgi:hypothetical protein
MKVKELIERKEQLIEQVLCPREAAANLECLQTIKGMVYEGLNVGTIPDALPGCLYLLDQIQEIFLALSYEQLIEDTTRVTTKTKANA